MTVEETIVRHIQEEPIEITSKVGMEIDSKGNKKPHVEITIKRMLAGNRETEMWELLRGDVSEQMDTVCFLVDNMTGGDE